MIIYDPLWETMKKKGITLDRLCEILDCGIEDICRHVKSDAIEK